MQLKFFNLLVDDQEKALRFYTGKLGFTKMADLPMGSFRWLTVTSPDGLPGVELILEALTFPPGKVYQKALFDAGIPMTAILTDDIHRDYALLLSQGVIFRGEPKPAGPIITVLFEDTCGNLINLVQPLVHVPDQS
jgi:catechol 2,3-dioxygenase-like lactoylglutathione lyase family enzyme